MILLRENDAPAYQFYMGSDDNPWIILGDHAGWLFPKENDFALSTRDRQRHITYDLGVKKLLSILSTQFSAHVIIGNYSRLVIDLNRPLNHPTSIVQVSDGTIISANQQLSEQERYARQDQIFWPYHRQIQRVIGRLISRGITPNLLSIHSFCPKLQGQEPRPWHAGILWNLDERLALKLYNFLLTESGWVIGQNQPYSGRDPCAFTLPFHAEPLGLPHALLEIRQDMLESENQIQKWVALIKVFMTNHVVTQKT